MVYTLIGYIYKITSPTGKIYIGQTKNILKRRRYYARHNCKNQKVLYRSLEKYGFINHVFEVIKICPVDEMCKWENYYIDHFDTLARDNGNGLNMRKTEVNGMIEEVRKKISEKRKGMIFSDETRRRMSAAKKGKPSPKKGQPSRGKQKSAFGYKWKYR